MYYGRWKFFKLFLKVLCKWEKMRETRVFQKEKRKNCYHEVKESKKIVEPCTFLKLLTQFSIVLKFTRTNQTFETNNSIFKGVHERLKPYTNKLQDTKESHVNNNNNKKNLRVNVSNWKHTCSSCKINYCSQSLSSDSRAHTAVF